MLGFLRTPKPSSGDTIRQIQDLTFLITRFGEPRLPRVPALLARHEPLSESVQRPDDSRSALDWAGDLFARAVSEAGMGAQLSHTLPRTAEDHLRPVSLSESWHEGVAGEVAYDVAGRGVCVFDEADTMRPGAVAADFFVQMALTRLVGTTPPDGFVSNDQAPLVLAALVFNGHGLEALGLLPQLRANPVFRRFDESELRAEIEELSVLAMYARGLVPEQIVASYGRLLDGGFRKRVFALHNEQRTYVPEMKILRGLCLPKRRRLAECKVNPALQAAIA